MGLGVFEEGLYPAPVLRRTGAAATGTDRTVLAFLGGEVCPDLFDPQVMAPSGGEVIVVGESFRGPQAKIAQPNPPRIITEAGTTGVADAVLASVDDEPVQVVAVPAERDLQCNTACRPAIGVSAGISRRRQINGLTPRTTTRS